MYKKHLHVCLFQPEIPQNTGNIGRLMAATQCRLHLITPLGFSMDDKNVLRPGLDYWPYLDLEIHNSLEEFLKLFSLERVAFFSKKAPTLYSEMSSEVDVLIFGRETSGLPQWAWDKYSQNFYGLPIYHKGVRSLNLSNTVAVATYHQLLRRELF